MKILTELIAALLFLTELAQWVSLLHLRVFKTGYCTV
jgi:hypothetical protein